MIRDDDIQNYYSILTRVYCINNMILYYIFVLAMIFNDIFSHDCVRHAL